MEAKNLGLTLFDILSYLLPGFVILIGISLFESTFVHTSFLNIDSLATHGIVSTLFAYFFGHICYSIASILQSIRYTIIKRNTENKSNKSGKPTKFWQWICSKIISKKENGLGESINRKISQSIVETYHLELNELSKLDKYLLADSYVVASGGEVERTSLIVREGFYKSSSVSLILLTILFLSSLFVGGIQIQSEKQVFQILGFETTFWVSILLMFISVLFGKRYEFFHRLKINNTFALFLAYKEKIKN